MTPEERLLKEQKIEALQRAKAYLPGDRFICIALLHAGMVNPQLAPAAEALTCYVLEQLHPHRVLELWQDHNHVSRKGPNKHRQQWVDWMINCIKEDLENDTV